MAKHYKMIPERKFHSTPKTEFGLENLQEERYVFEVGANLPQAVACEASSWASVSLAWPRVQLVLLHMCSTKNP